jgi:hypothetical protein
VPWQLASRAGTSTAFGPNSVYSSMQGVKVVVNGMIMMLVVILEDRLSIGQENLDQLINQYETINLFIVSPIISPTILPPIEFQIILNCLQT